MQINVEAYVSMAPLIFCTQSCECLPLGIAIVPNQRCVDFLTLDADYKHLVDIAYVRMCINIACI